MATKKRTRRGDLGAELLQQHFRTNIRHLDSLQFLQDRMWGGPINFYNRKTHFHSNDGPIWYGNLVVRLSDAKLCCALNAAGIGIAICFASRFIENVRGQKAWILVVDEDTLTCSWSISRATAGRRERLLSGFPVSFFCSMVPLQNRFVCKTLQKRRNRSSARTASGRRTRQPPGSRLPRLSTPAHVHH